MANAVLGICTVNIVIAVNPDSAVLLIVNMMLCTYRANIIIAALLFVANAMLLAEPVLL